MSWRVNLPNAPPFHFLLCCNVTLGIASAMSEASGDSIQNEKVWRKSGAYGVKRFPVLYGSFYTPPHHFILVYLHTISFSAPPPHVSLNEMSRGNRGCTSNGWSALAVKESCASYHPTPLLHTASPFHSFLHTVSLPLLR